MKLLQGSISRVLVTALFLGMAPGCQSLSRQTAATGASSSPPAPPMPIAGRTKSSPASASVKSPVQLTGFTPEDSTEAEAASVPPSTQSPESSVKRDVRPVYFGQSAIRDPNAGADEAEARTNTPTVSPIGHRRVVLFGDDPEKLFREEQTPALQLNPGIAPETEEAEPQPLPSLVVPEAASPASSYDQALQLPADTISVRHDFQTVIPTVWDDTKSLFTWQNACITTVAAGGAVAIRESGLDNHVRQSTLHHEERWGEGDDVLRQFGEPKWQVPALFALYGYSVWQQDAELHDFSRALIEGYSLSGILTVTLKGICDTQRPSDNYYNGRWGFPSFHTSSIFAIGGVTEEYYGWQAGLPIYVLGGLVGWSRIDQREHDLSDVLFGAALGYVVGKSVGANHAQKEGRGRWSVEPYYDPLNSSSGINLQTSF